MHGEHQAARLGYSFNLMADSLQEKIVQLERLSTLQQRFVSDVSHEFVYPLSTVRLGTELLYDSREDMEQPLAALWSFCTIRWIVSSRCLLTCWRFLASMPVAQC